MSVPIYYINLASRLDRRSFMERQFAQLGLPANRIEAVASHDGWSPPTLRPSQYACALSHIAAWRAMLCSTAPHALILEDDAILSSRLPGFLAALGPLPADIVKIETNPRPLTCSAPFGETDGIKFREFRSTGWGAAGYIIGRETAERLIAHPYLLHGAIDMTLFRRVRAPASELRIFQTDPGLCIQVGNTELRSSAPEAQSDIRASTVRDRPAVVRLGGYTLSQQFTKAWERIGRRDLEHVIVPFTQ